VKRGEYHGMGEERSGGHRGNKKSTNRKRKKTYRKTGKSACKKGEAPTSREE